MSESAGTDSILRGQSMPRPYSNDLRARVIEAIEAGASRREVAERYELRASVVVLWAQRFEQTGSVAAKPSGGSTSPLEDHADFSADSDCQAAGFDAGRDRCGDGQTRDLSRSAVWRFFERRSISFKKNSVRSRATARRSGPRAPALDARARHV